MSVSPVEDEYLLDVRQSDTMLLLSLLEQVHQEERAVGEAILDTSSASRSRKSSGSNRIRNW